MTNEFIEKDAKVVEAKTEDVEEPEETEKPKSKSQKVEEPPPEKPYVLPEYLKPEHEVIKEECEKLGQRAEMLDFMAKNGIIPNPTVFRFVDEILIANFLKNMATHYGLTTEELVKLLEFTATKKQQEMIEGYDGDDEEGRSRGGYEEFMDYQ